MKKKSTIFHFTLLGIMLYYSFKFYSSISIEIAVLVAIFSMIKPNLFMTAIKDTGIKRIICGTLALIIIGLDLLAISSSFINKYNAESISKSINAEYIKQQDKIKQLRSNIVSIEAELNNYPSLASYTANSPKWEDKTALNQTWQDGKKDITNRLNTAQQEYNKELSKKVDKYNIVNKQNGYNAIFTSISKKTGVKTGGLVQIVYMIIAILLEIMILYTKTQKEKESKNYVKSPKELMSDLIDKVNYNMHIKILESFENFSNNLLLAIVQKTIEPELEVQQIEGEKLNKILKQNEQILELNSSQKKDTDNNSNVENDEIIIQKPIEVLEQKPIINLVKKENIKPSKKPDKNVNPKYKKIRTFLEQNYNSDECINSSELQKKFRLKVNEYRSILGQLKNDNVVYTSNRKTYMSSKLKAVK